MNRIHRQKSNENRIKDWLQYACLCAMGILIGWNLFQMTMWEIDWPDGMADYVTHLLLAFVIARLALEKSCDWKEMIFILFFVAVCMTAYTESGYGELYFFMLLLLAAKGISDQKIVGMYFVVVGLITVITIVAALTGHIENLIYHYEGRNVRIAFGANYPTDFAALIFYLELSFAFLRRRKLNKIDAVTPFILAVALYAACEARWTAICLGLLGCGMILYLNRKWITKHFEGVVSIGTFLMSCSAGLFAIVMIAFTYGYRSTSRIWRILDALTSHRLSNGHVGTELYDISLLGQNIPMMGNGGTTASIKNYFFIDSSYVKALLCYGVVALILIVGILLFMQFQVWKRKDWMYLLILTLVAFHCIIEQHAIEAMYNPFIWLLLASAKDSKEKKGEQSLA